MACDPAIPDCAPGCQGLIDKIYYDCDGICLPDGYYYDPGEQYIRFIYDI
jgi:hypothetical protein